MILEKERFSGGEVTSGDPTKSCEFEITLSKKKLLLHQLNQELKFNYEEKTDQDVCDSPSSP